jgi:diguanylate cyclase (GGDEF)-like protein
MCNLAAIQSIAEEPILACNFANYPEVSAILQKSDGKTLQIPDSIYSYPFCSEVSVVNWSEFPDLAAVVLLTGAFASVAWRSLTHVSRVWLTGWVMIALHFAAFLFLPAPGIWGSLAAYIGSAALIWAGLLFMWASVPDRKETSSRWILAALLGTNTLYVGLIIAGPAAAWALNPAAALVGVLPLLAALVPLQKPSHPLRWGVIGLYSTLSIFLLLFQHRPGNGADLALNAVIFTVYFGCCVSFLFAYRRATSGAFITIAGFLAWAAVFVVAPWMEAFLPTVHVESEVWNLPKYVVAVGMILVLLEDQIEHNRHLALHDYLTGLPNRRLYQDRLARTLERARRSKARAALLVVDLDSFKQVNDTMGHHVGDLVLQQVAAMFSARVRRSDTVARTGGDEFSIILEEPTSREDAVRVGQALMQIFNEPLQLGKHTVRVGASIGIAVFPEDAVDMEALCIAADLRMYDVKHDSKGTGEQVAFALPRSLLLSPRRGQA